jgi:hypothetical protein
MGGTTVGPALYTSPVENLSGTGNYDLVDFNTGGIPLNNGQQYMLIASTAGPNSVGMAEVKYEFDGLP